jgi:hypothetical protein
VARYQNGSLRVEQRAKGPTWVFRYYVTRFVGKRVEHKTPVGLVSAIGSDESSAWREVDRQRLREAANQLQPFRGRPRTFGQLAQHYIEHELQEDQSEAMIEKAYTTTETYKRILTMRIGPRFGGRAALSIEPLEVEQWLKQIKKAEDLENPTLDKIRRVMDLVYKHGQRYGLMPRDEAANPIRWVRQSTQSSYTALTFSPEKAFDIVLNIPEPRRTLVLTDAVTALRVSEILALQWMDIDFAGQVINVRRAYVWGRFKDPKSRVPGHRCRCILYWQAFWPHGGNVRHMLKTTTSYSPASVSGKKSRCRPPSWCRSTCARPRPRPP